MKKLTLIVLILSTIALNAEQSVYSDNDFIDSDAVAKKNSREIFLLKQQISQLKEKIEGLKSIVQGQANTIEQLRVKSNNNLENIVNQLSQRVATLESRPAQVIQKESSVTTSTTSGNSQETTKGSKDKKLTSKELFKKSVIDFNNNRLTKAQKGFKELIKRSYKKASSNFYLGEIAYKKRRYKEAIGYYQKSVTINDNAAYMDKLLLHTAISLKKKGRNSEAKNFFNAVVASYPDSASAKEAKKYLK